MAAIRLMPWKDAPAAAVFRSLDPHDWIEAQIARGGDPSWMMRFADWREARQSWLASHVLATHGGTPFAVLAVTATAQAGVAEAAFLARDHWRFRHEIACAGVLFRQRLPGWAREHGLHRIEARAWEGHPSAPRFLQALGFRLEARLRGFGVGGNQAFLQFAFITDDHRNGKD